MQTTGGTSPILYQMKGCEIEDDHKSYNSSCSTSPSNTKSPLPMRSSVLFTYITVNEPHIFPGNAFWPTEYSGNIERLVTRPNTLVVTYVLCDMSSTFGPKLTITRTKDGWGALSKRADAAFWQPHVYRKERPPRRSQGPDGTKPVPSFIRLSLALTRYTLHPRSQIHPQPLLSRSQQR